MIPPHTVGGGHAIEVCESGICESGIRVQNVYASGLLGRMSPPQGFGLEPVQDHPSFQSTQGRLSGMTPAWDWQALSSCHVIGVAALLGGGIVVTRYDRSLGFGLGFGGVPDNLLGPLSGGFLGYAINPGSGIAGSGSGTAGTCGSHDGMEGRGEMGCV